MDIVIEGGGTEILSDIRREEFAQLASELSDLGYSVEVLAREPRGRGVTWWELTFIYLGLRAVDAVVFDAYDASIKLVMRKATDWAKRHLDRDPDRGRPQYIAIYGPRGELLKSVLVERDGITDKTAHDLEIATSRTPPDLDD